MSSIAVPVTSGELAGLRGRALPAVRTAMEGLVMLIVCGSPWPFGSVDPEFEFILYAGIALLLLLWACEILLAGRLNWKKCPVTLCLAGLFLIGMWQILPLSSEVLTWVSPGTASLYAELQPEEPEILSVGMGGQTAPARGGPPSVCIQGPRVPSSCGCWPRSSFSRLYVKAWRPWLHCGV